MMVGWGGNNGSTLSATILANRHSIVWHTKAGVQQPNYIGSLLRASTVRLGLDPATGKMVRPAPSTPFSALVCGASPIAETGCVPRSRAASKRRRGRR